MSIKTSLQNNILYRKFNDDLLLVIPKTMQYDIIKQTHDKGHFSVGKMERLLKKEFWFSRMRDKVEKTVRNCIPCILAERKHGKSEGLLHNIGKGDTPLDTYHVDHIEPIPSTRKNYAHLLVVIDSFSKFVWLYSTRSTTTVEVIARLTKQAAIFGNPRRIITDHGTAFTSGDFKAYCDCEKIEHILTTVGVPRGNGQVERINRIVIPLFSKLSAPHPENWFKHVDRVQQFLNATPARSTGFSPFEILLGQCMRLRDDFELRRLIEEDTINDLQEKRASLREQARAAVEKIQRENKKIYNRKRKKSNLYHVGDWVAIKRTQAAPGRKFHAKFLGPYEIIKVLRGDRFVVAKVGEHEGPRTTSTAADNMKRWISPNYIIDDDHSDNSDIETNKSDASETDD